MSEELKACPFCGKLNWHKCTPPAPDSTIYAIEYEDRHDEWIQLYARSTLEEARKDKESWESREENDGHPARIVEISRRVVG